MRRFFLSATLVLFSAGGAAAERYDTKDIHEAIAAGDFSSLSEGLQGAQEAFLGGEITADAIRKLYITLSRSDPDTVKFVERWAKAEPDNASALIARAWSLYNGARFVGSDNNYYANTVASNMREEMHELAWRAYQIDPMLIPASDALIREIGNYAPERPQPIQVLDEVLDQTPNFGSIQRFSWSRELKDLSANIQRKVCGGLSDSFSKEEKGQIYHRCILKLARHHNRSEIEQYASDYMWTDNDPNTELDRLVFLVSKYEFAEATRVQIDWAIERLQNMEVDQFELITLHWVAKRLQEKMRRQHQYHEDVVTTFRKARLKQAQGYLEHDPYNTELIDFVDGAAFAPETMVIKKADGSVTIRSIPFQGSESQKKDMRERKKAEALAFAQDRLWASPYDPDHWSRYAQLVRRRNIPASLFEADAAMQNAIAFSTYPMTKLSTFLNEKSNQWKLVVEVHSMPQEHIDQLPNWAVMRGSVELSETILCPYLRAHLLRKYLCDYYPEGTAGCSTWELSYPEDQLELVDTASSTPACSGLLTAEYPELLFTPIPIEDAIVVVE